jgi:hypothetical protein
MFRGIHVQKIAGGAAEMVCDDDAVIAFLQIGGNQRLGIQMAAAAGIDGVQMGFDFVHGMHLSDCFFICVGGVFILSNWVGGVNDGGKGIWIIDKKGRG